jgi:integrase
LVGQKRPLKPKDVWSIRARLEIDGRERDLALFNLAIDSKLRTSDLVNLRVEDVQIGGRARERATTIQQKTARPVQFELTDGTRKAYRFGRCTAAQAQASCSPTAAGANLISRRVSTLASFMAG